MAFIASESGIAPLIGPETRRALGRRVAELWGAGLGLVGLLIGLALASYHPSDPSQFSAPGADPLNWLGRPGAVLADPLMRVLGLAAWLIVAIPLAWAARLLLHRGEERIWAGIALAPVAVVVTAAFAATHAIPEGWPLAVVAGPSVGLGGHLGDWAAGGLIGVVPGIDDAALRALSFVLGLASISTTAAAAGVSRREAAGVLRWCFAGLRSVVASAIVIGRETEPAPRPPKTAAPARPAWLSRALELPAQAYNSLRPRADAAADAEEPIHEAEQDPAVTALGSAIRRLRGEAEDETDPAEFRLEPTLATPAEPKPAARALRETQTDAPEDETSEDTAPASPPPEIYDAPPLALLQRPPASIPGPLGQPPETTLEEQARRLEEVLADYGVRGEIVAVKPGPVVTLYELEPAPGLKAARVIGLADDIARSMSALAARVSTVPGRSVIGIELPNLTRETVFLREVLEHPDYAQSRHTLALALGKGIGGEPVIANLAKMPHLLIAGTTGSGKSVAINTMILSLLYRLPPEKVKLILVDPKMLELNVYDGIPQLLSPVVTEPKQAVVALKWTVREMESRYRAMSKLGVRNIEGYNQRLREARERGEVLTRRVQTGFDPDTGKPLYEEQPIDLTELPYIVLVVDEMADLMMVAGKDIEAAIQRLAQMARAAGIHLIMATQRPSVDVITGTIKANFPTRISFQVTSKVDSRTILGEGGAEQLLGQGDMLFMAGGGRITRVHGPFVSDREVEAIVAYLKTQGEPAYNEAVLEDEDEPMGGLDPAGLGTGGGEGDDLYDQAVALVARERKASTSFVQRHLQIGYNRAARLIERMEADGVVGQANHVGKREVLVGDHSGDV